MGPRGLRKEGSNQNHIKKRNTVHRKKTSSTKNRSNKAEKQRKHMSKEKNTVRRKGLKECLNTRETKQGLKKKSTHANLASLRTVL